MRSKTKEVLWSTIEASRSCSSGLPMLCGFHVNDDLEVLQIAVHTWPAAGWPGRELPVQ